MKYIYVLILFCTLLSCKSALLNAALESRGIYDDTIVLKRMTSRTQEIVFFPMHHIGTNAFYDDVGKKVDSLNNLDFNFFLEEVIGDKKDDNIVRKIRKITGLPFTEKGYTQNIDSIFGDKFKPKKKIIDQPSYENMGIKPVNSERVDVDFNFIIQYYESNYSEIILENCDFETTIYEFSSCENDSVIMTKEIRNDVLVNSRNKYVIDRILNDSLHNKIAVIYGKKHIEGIKQALIDKGYTEN